MKRIIGYTAAVLVALVPAALGLWGNASFASAVATGGSARQAVVRHAEHPAEHSAKHRAHHHRAKARHHVEAQHAEPGDDHGQHAEPGDDHGQHAEPGDDHGQHAEPGDDHGGHHGGGHGTDD